MATDTQWCSQCHKTLPLDQFKAKKAGGVPYGKTCKNCLAVKKAAYNEKKKSKEKDTPSRLKASIHTLMQASSCLGRDVPARSEPDTNSATGPAEPSSSDSDASSEYLDLSEISLQEFSDLLLEQSTTAISAVARVNVASLLRTDLRTTSDAIASWIWDVICYKFTYQSKYEHQRSPTIRFNYHCAQQAKRQHEPKKTAPEDGQRNKQQMHSFECSGWLFITLSEGEDVALIKIHHADDHVPYWKIEIPEEIKTYITANASMKPGQLWDDILKRDPHPVYTRRSVFAMWNDLDSKKWKRDEDQLKSARILLEEASKSGSSSTSSERLYEVEPIPLPEKADDGFSALAFALVPLLRQWGGQIREISIDSAWNTNGARYEIYALLGEVYGSGCPLGYLLIQTSVNHDEDGKTKYIEALLEYFRSNWLHRVIQTLSDKDRSEINAFLRRFPDAKHQLCFWHCLRAIRTRLSILRRRPAYYNADTAADLYDFIDRDWLPIAQSKHPDRDKTSFVAQTAIPILNIRLGGVLQTAPPVVPKIMIRLNGQAVHDYRTKAAAHSPLPDAIPFTEDSDLEVDADLESYIDRQDDVPDQEDGPDWMFESGEKSTKDPDYVFCPLAHRKPLLHLFTRHFCRHPVFPRRDGTCQTAAEIERLSVWEMHSFCSQRGLREVWAYMWTSWYCPKMWKLWARSSSAFVTRLRTTMNTENFWKQLKHEHLHHLLRPRLDQLVYILIHKVTPLYVTRMDFLAPENRLGRAKALTPFQTGFRKAWSELLKAKISVDALTTYKTDAQRWICQCGRQMYHSFHLCKHLVRVVPPPSPRFWGQVSRRRVLPLYRHFDLGNRSSHDTGAVTDGDDQIWLGDKSELSGGRWRRLIGGSQVLGKHSTVDADGDIVPSMRGPWVSERRLQKRPRMESPSPVSPPPSAQSAPLNHLTNGTEDDPILLPSSDDTFPENFEEEQRENEAEVSLALMLKRADAFETAARILREQAGLSGNTVFFNSLSRQNLGSDVEAFVEDIGRLHRGHSQPHTWASTSRDTGKRGSKKRETRRVANTLGYQIDRGSSSEPTQSGGLGSEIMEVDDLEYC